MPSKSSKKQGGTCLKKGGNSQLQGSKFGGKRKTLRKTYRKRGGQQQNVEVHEGGQQQNDELNEGGQLQEKQQYENDMSGGRKCNGYCVSCKRKSTMKNCKNKKTKNGRNMVAGVCVKCGTKMAKFVK